ncbi:MAG TPA: hypothetical protein VGK24_04355 [Candidatus Angelobacter sp.]|jgi:hypothetical protein
MKIHKDVVIDLLPVYFSGEASMATRELVEECFRENHELERIARGANKSVELVTVAPVPPDDWENKLALELARERARVRAEAWHAVSGGMGLFFSVATAAFKIQGHRIFFQVWQKPSVGLAFMTVACILWLAFWAARSRFLLLSRRFRTLLWAYYFSACTLSFLLLNAVTMAYKEQVFTSPLLIVMVASMAAGVWSAYFLTGEKEKAD